MSDAQTDFTLPPSLVTKTDIARLMREFEALDNALTATTVHEKIGADGGEAPAQSPQLSAFLDANPVNLEDSGARSDYIKKLRALKNDVHVMNMTFAVVADPESLQQLAAWTRENINPCIVIDAHLQPAIVAGLYLRSQNKVFDFSVRNALKSKQGELKQELEALRG